MAKNLFVAGLSYDTTNDSLKNHFAEIGVVSSAQVIMDKYTQRSKGFGFVEMSTDEEGAAAMEKLNNSSLDGRNIVVKEARPREENNNRSYSGGGGSGGYNNGYNKGNSYGRDDRRKDNRNRY
jgi:RNA recognition motif-containing protein